MDLGGCAGSPWRLPTSPSSTSCSRAGPAVRRRRAAAQLDELVAKGAGGTLFFQVDGHPQDVRRLVEKGVEIIQEPIERFYGIDTAFRDDSGNQIRVNQPAATDIPWPEDTMTAKAQAAAE